MAKRLSREEVVTIQVLSEKGMPKRQIAREVGVTESTVRYHVQRGREGARDGRRTAKVRRADAAAAEIDAWLDANGQGDRPPNLKALYEHLVEECGYEGSYKSVVRWVRAKHSKPAIRTYRRVETPPGAQTQTDWGHFKPIWIGSEQVPLLAFVMTLSYSRGTALVWSRSKDQLHWLGYQPARLVASISNAPEIENVILLRLDFITPSSVMFSVDSYISVPVYSKLADRTRPSLLSQMRSPFRPISSLRLLRRPSGPGPSLPVVALSQLIVNFEHSLPLS